MSFDGGKAEARRLVRARAEGHARLDADHDPFIRLCNFAPRRRNQKTRANRDGLRCASSRTVVTPAARTSPTFALPMPGIRM